MSLSRKLRGKKSRDNNVMEEPDDSDRFDHVLFISDRKLDGDLKEKLSTWPSIVSYNDNFTNRTTDDLVAAGIKHVWIDISHQKGREWLQLNLKTCTEYTKIVVYSGTSRNKFLKDLSDYVDIVIKSKELKKLQALTFPELMEKTEDLLKIHEPANCIAALFGCSKNVEESKKNF